MKRIAVALVLCVSLLGPAALAGAVEIFYPSDMTYVPHADYLIVKGGAPQLETMVLAFNGLRSEPINVGDVGYRRVFRDLLIIPAPPFEVGRNEIVAEGYVAGKLVSSAHATIYYQPDYTEAPPEGFQKFVMHVPDKEAKCADCHVMQIDKAQMSISDPGKNPCLSCHKAMIKEKYVHGPVGSYSCGDCHTISKKGERYPVAKRGAQLCNECHEEQHKAFRQNAYVHGPVAVGLCETCHDPHGSSERFQLVKPTNDLCLGCHERVGRTRHVVQGVATSHPLKGVKDPSAPGRELSCASCHNPHGQSGPAFLRGGALTAYEVCGRCHKK